MKFVMSKAMVAVIIVASVCILRVLKTTTTNTGVKLSAIFVKTWTITLPWSSLKWVMLPPMIIFHVKCALIIKNLLKQQRLLPPVASIISTFTSWHSSLANALGNGCISIPALDRENQAQPPETFTCIIKEVYISCCVPENNTVK